MFDRSDARRGAMRVARATILVAALAAPAPTRAQTPATSAPARSVYEDLQMFSQVLNQIRVNHPDSVDSHDLLMAAIQGMVHAADPHSFVIPMVRLSPAREQALKDGKLVPIPLEFEYRSGAPIVSPSRREPRPLGRTFFRATS